MRIRCLKTVQLEEIHNDDSKVNTVYEVNRNYKAYKVTTTDGEFVDIHFDWGYIKDVNKKIFSFGGPIEQISDVGPMEALIEGVNKELKEEVIVEE